MNSNKTTEFRSLFNSNRITIDSNNFHLTDLDDDPNDDLVGVHSDGKLHSVVVSDQFNYTYDANTNVGTLDLSSDVRTDIQQIDTNTADILLCLPLDGSRIMSGNLQLGGNNITTSGSTINFTVDGLLGGYSFNNSSGEQLAITDSGIRLDEFDYVYSLGDLNLQCDTNLDGDNSINFYDRAEKTFSMNGGANTSYKNLTIEDMKLQLQYSSDINNIYTESGGDLNYDVTSSADIHDFRINSVSKLSLANTQNISTNPLLINTTSQQLQLQYSSDTAELYVANGGDMYYNIPLTGNIHNFTIAGVSQMEIRDSLNVSHNNLRTQNLDVNGNVDIETTAKHIVMRYTAGSDCEIYVDTNNDLQFDVPAGKDFDFNIGGTSFVSITNGGLFTSNLTGYDTADLTIKAPITQDIIYDTTSAGQNHIFKVGGVEYGRINTTGISGANINQSLLTTSSPTFNNLTLSGALDCQTFGANTNHQFLTTTEFKVNMNGTEALKLHTDTSINYVELGASLWYPRINAPMYLNSNALWLQDNSGIEPVLTTVAGSDNYIRCNTTTGSEEILLDQDVTVAVDKTLWVTTLRTHSISNNTIELNAGGSGNRYCILDLHGDDTYTDYGLRVIRENTGANAVSKLIHRGTGDFVFEGMEASSLKFETSNVERASINSTGLNLASGLNFQVNSKKRALMYGSAFALRTTTGSTTITGVGFEPQFIKFSLCHGALSGRVITVIGFYSASNGYQGCNSNDASPSQAYTYYSGTQILHWKDPAGTSLIQGTITSVNSDGFVYNLSQTNGTAYTIMFECYC